jgi:ribonuclease P/MRP protein subunit RPP1
LLANCGGIKLFFDFQVDENRELVEEAVRLGYSGLALFNEEKIKDSDPSKNRFDREELKKKFSIELYKGVLIRAKNPEDMKRKVGKFRKDADVIMVQGGDQKINRTASEDPRVDIISHPYYKRRDCGINHVIGKKAAENDVAVELNIKYLSKTSSYLRYKVLSHYREILKLQRKFGFPLIITSHARSIYDLHSPQDIIALSGCFGMSHDEASSTLSENPQKIIERSKMRNKIIVDGVKIIE